MKNFTLLICTLLFGFSAFSQVRLEKNEVTVKMGYTEYEKEVYVKVYNDGNNTCEINLRREVKEAPFGSINYFCWGPNCYPENANESNPGSPVIIDPQGVDNSFTSYYNPENTPGVAVIDYHFTNANDTSDNAMLTVTFDATEATSSVSQLNDNSVKLAYNASNQMLTMVLENMVGAGSVEIKDISGRTVFADAVKFDTGILMVPTNKLKPGIHIVTLLNENGSTLNLKKVSIY